MSISIFRAGTSQIIGTKVDLRLGEIHTSEAQITAQTVEDGSVISDHIILQPQNVEVIAEINDYDPNIFTQGIGEKAKTSWLEFKRQFNNRTLYDLVTTHEIYSNMALRSLIGEHIAPRRGFLTVKLQFTQVSLTQTSIVKIDSRRLKSTGTDKVDKTASSEIDAGTIPVETPEDTTRKSILARIVDLFGGAK